LDAIQLKSPDEIESMYRVNQVVAEALQAMVEIVRPGVTTAQLDEVARKVLEKNKAQSAFLNYPHPNGGRPFPATVCTSPNDMIVHGIPSENVVLKEGDILSMDFGAILDGWAGDSAVTVPVGNVSRESRDLMDATRQSLYAGIDKARDGNRLGDISHAVQELAESRGYGVVRDFVGHGIGRKMHEPPPIPNVGQEGKGIRIKAGMTFAIEPMINMGSPDIRTGPDGWGALTKDHKLSAHFEHSIAVTPDGPRILSAWS